MIRVEKAFLGVTFAVSALACRITCGGMLDDVVGVYTNKAEGADARTMQVVRGGCCRVDEGSASYFFTYEEGTYKKERCVFMHPTAHVGTMVVSWDAAARTLTTVAAAEEEGAVDEEDFEDIPADFADLGTFVRVSDAVADDVAESIRKEVETLSSVKRAKQDEKADKEAARKREPAVQAEALKVAAGIKERPSGILDIALTYPNKDGRSESQLLLLDAAMRGLCYAMADRELPFEESDLLKLLDKCDWEKGIVLVSLVLSRKEISADSMSKLSARVERLIGNVEETFLYSVYEDKRMPDPAVKNALKLGKAGKGLTRVLEKRLGIDKDVEAMESK